METSNFTDKYKALQSILAELKPKFTQIDTNSFTLRSISKHDEITKLDEETRGLIIDAQLLIDNYSGQATSILKEIGMMSNEGNKDQEEKDLFDQEMEGADGPTNLPRETVSLSNFMSEKEKRFERTIAAAIKSANLLACLIVKPDPSHDAQSNDSIPNGSGDQNALVSSITNILGTIESSLSMSKESHRPNIALPPIKLEQFDGSDIVKWPAFKYQMHQLILSQPHLSEVEKAFYLRSSLKGAALTLVSSIPVHENFLVKIVSRLESEYDRHNLTQAKLLQSLLSIRAKSPKISDQLAAVQSMINLAHSIHEECGVDGLIVQQQVAERIHSRFISFIWRSKPRSMLSALELIEDELRREIEDATMTNAFTSHHHTVSAPTANSPGVKPNRPSPPTQSYHPSSFTTAKEVKKPQCVFCGQHTYSGECAKVTSIKDRKAILNKKSLCYCCFSPNHPSSNCHKSCPLCSGKHHRSICEKPSSQRIVTTIAAEHAFQHNARLFTASAVLTDTDLQHTSSANVLLDHGSQLSIISRDLASRLHLVPIGQIMLSVTGLKDGDNNAPIPPTLHDIVRINMVTTGGTRTMSAVVRDTIVASIQLQPLSNSDLSIIKDTLTSVPRHLTEPTFYPDLLLSVDETLNLLEDSKTTTLPTGYRLYKSPIGPIVAGAEKAHSTSGMSFIDQSCPSSPSTRSSVASIVTSYEMTTSEATLEQKVERLLSVDPISRIYGTTEREARKEADEMVTKHFDDTIQHQADGYYVQYALKPDAQSDLPDNHDLAVSRLASIVRKLSKDRKLLEYYDSVIKEQLSLGQIEMVDPADTRGLIHYLAHQPVLRPDKPTTPLRIVYDASAHLKNKPSLNDIIHPGPSDLEQIPAILLRARSRSCLIIADVEKAFLQVKLCPSQRNMLRFLWLKDLDKPVTQQNLLILRFCVTPFGVNQSPCLLNKVINYHIKMAGNDCDPSLVSQLLSNIYVDNIVINVDRPLHSMYTQCKHLFNAMSMNLRDFASNDPSFNEALPESDRAKGSHQKLLGLEWNVIDDTLSLNIPISDKLEKETKRTMLSATSSTYDPLGLLTPLILPARLTVQSLWNKQLKWDEAVDADVRDSFHSQISDVEKFSLPINRYSNLSGADEITLAAFSDASMTAMAACVYSWVPDHPPSLLISKTRLAPIKSTSTIPKMELDSFVMAHTLLRFTIETLRKEFPDVPIRIYTFSDSAVVLHWCKPDFSKPVGVFVSNRIKQIHSIREELASYIPLTYEPPRHVRSEYNPADHATRGLSAQEMNDPSHQWWVGPPWLQSDPSSWPNENLSDLHCPLAESFSLSSHLITTSSPPLETIIDLSRYSSMRKAITVTAHVYRFISQCVAKGKNKTIQEKLKHIPHNHGPTLDAREKRFALQSLIRLHQKIHVSDDDPFKKNKSIIEDSITGLLRINTRLANTDLPDDFKEPIYIPSSHDSTLARLLISDVHYSSSHASSEIVLNSLKSRYFIPRARTLVKSTLKKCVPCRKTNNLPFKYPHSPPLPHDRVRQSLPFEHCGIDYAGPFNIADDQKLWLVVFTCFSTRLTHLEVVSSMLPSSFIFAFRRFCSRRGTPSNITSDKGTTFTSSSKLLSTIEADYDVNTLFSNMGINWKFTSAHSPWKGGIYERLIKIVKQSLTRSIGQRKLSREEFETVMCEIEALLNSRPLSYISSDDVTTFNGPILRPIDLILPHTHLGCPINLNTADADDDYIPPEEENASRKAAIAQLSRSISVVENFWRRWHAEYLTSLRDSSSKSDPLQSTRSSTILPKRGSIVLVVDESGNTPRSNWKMAKILSLTDTSATLCSHAGRIIERPLNLLIPLEIHSVEEPTTTDISIIDAPLPNHPMTTRAKAKKQRIRHPASNHHDGHELDEEFNENELLYDDTTQRLVTAIEHLTSRLESTTRAIEELPRKIEKAMAKTNDAGNELQKKILKEVSSISFEIPAILNEKLAKAVIPHRPPPPNSIVTPKSQQPSSRFNSNRFNPYSPRDVNRPSSSRDRSRSPIHRPSNNSFVKNSHTVCVFCRSSVHLSRNCLDVTSLSTRLSIMQSENRCYRCFRPINDAHSPSCEPEICSQKCEDNLGRPIRHQQWFCPQNERLSQ